MFELSFSIATSVLLIISIVCLLIQLLYGIRAYARAADFENPEPAAPDESHPKATVIVYCQSDDEVLASAVESISRQDYPDFEIVVVCDASSEHADLLNERFSAQYSNVYVTFVQPGSHNLSRRKLATTIGIKAAKGEIIVTTVANVTIPSESWLSSLLAPFCGPQGKYTDVSLGLSRMRFDELRGPGRWYRQFDTFLTNALWIAYAAWGKPYRGDGYNLAFRREVFFKHKGYARTINLHNGDDDLFINEIANGSNTKVVVGGESIIETYWGEAANRVWSMRKERYSFTSRWLPHAPFVRSSVMMGLQWLVPASCVAAALTGLPSLVPAIAGGLILAAFWGTEIYRYRRLAARFGGVRLWWAVVPFWLWRPIGDQIFRYDHRNSRKKNFTWQR